MSSTTKPAVWLGIADVIPAEDNDCLGKASGAFVGVAGFCGGEAEFRQLVERELQLLGFKVFSLEDIGEHDSSLPNSDVEAALLSRIGELSPEAPFIFGSFHSYSTSKN